MRSQGFSRRGFLQTGVAGIAGDAEVVDCEIQFVPLVPIRRPASHTE